MKSNVCGKAVYSTVSESDGNGDSVTADFYYATKTVEMQADFHGRRSQNVTVLHLHYYAICRPQVVLGEKK